MTARIKYRGGYSIGFPKKNFTISLETEFKFNGLKKDDDWILNASVVDKTFLRNVINYKLFNSFDKNNIAPKTKYAEIFTNDNYYGFYVLTERLDKSSLNLNDKSLIFKEPYVFRERDSRQDSIARFLGNYYHQKLPKMEDNRTVIDSLRSFIFYSSDSVFEKQVFKIFSKQNIIDWHILLLLANNGDGLMKNFVLYRKNGSCKFKIAPWDCDHSFGRDGDNKYNMLERVIDVKRNKLLKRLLENKNLNYNKALKNRWKKLRKKNIVDTEKLKGFIDSESEKIKPFVKRNFEKWPLDQWPHQDANGFEQELDIIKEYIDLRIPQLDSLFFD